MAVAMRISCMLRRIRQRVRSQGARRIEGLGGTAWWVWMYAAGIRVAWRDRRDSLTLSSSGRIVYPSYHRDREKTKRFLPPICGVRVCGETVSSRGLALRCANRAALLGHFYEFIHDDSNALGIACRSGLGSKGVFSPKISNRQL